MAEALDSTFTIANLDEVRKYTDGMGYAVETEVAYDLYIVNGKYKYLWKVGAVNLISGLGGGPSQSTSSQSASISVPGYVEVAAASMFDTTTSSIKSLSGRKKFDQPDGSEVWEVTIYYLLPNGGPVHVGPTAISVNK